MTFKKYKTMVTGLNV